MRTGRLLDVARSQMDKAKAYAKAGDLRRARRYAVNGRDALAAARRTTGRNPSTPPRLAPVFEAPAL